MNFVMKSKGNEEKSRVILPSHQLTPPYMCNAERQKRTNMEEKERTLFVYLLLSYCCTLMSSYPRLGAPNNSTVMVNTFVVQNYIA